VSERTIQHQRASLATEAGLAALAQVDHADAVHTADKKVRPLCPLNSRSFPSWQAS